MQTISYSVLTMTLRQLRIFEAIASSLSITKAAYEMGINQPSVSKQLRLLEEEFGVRFHVRSGQGIEITEHGIAFLSRVRPILREIGQLHEIFPGKGTKENFTLRIVGSESPSASALPLLLKSFKKTHPKVRTVLLTSDAATAEKMLMTSEAEIGLVSNPGSNPQVFLEPLWNEEVLAVVSARSPLAKKDRLTLEQLAKFPVVAKTGTIVRHLQGQGVKLNIVMQCRSVAALEAAIKAGLGLGFLYRGVARADLQNGTLKVIRIPELKKPDIKCFVLYNKDRPLSPNAQDFVGLLRRWRQRSKLNELRRAG